MSDTWIRPGKAEDDQMLGEIEQRMWSHVHAVTPKPKTGKPFFDEKHAARDVLVAELDGRIAGYVRVVPPTPLPSNAHVQQINGLLVDCWARGRGVGRALVEGAIELARQRGTRRLTLRVLGHTVDLRHQAPWLMAGDRGLQASSRPELAEGAGSG